MLGFSQYWRGRRWEGREWKMTWLKMDEWARKGRFLNLFFFFPPWLPLCGDLLIVQTCLQREIRNKCVGSWVRWKKGGRLEILRRLWTDGLSDWISQSNCIQTLHPTISSPGCSTARGKEKWIDWSINPGLWFRVKYLLKNLYWHDMIPQKAKTRVLSARLSFKIKGSFQFQSYSLSSLCSRLFLYIVPNIINGKVQRENPFVQTP